MKPLAPALLLLSMSLSTHATVVPPKAPFCCDEMPVSCRTTPCKADLYDCSRGTVCLKKADGQTFPCELKDPSRFDRAFTNSTAAIEYFKSHGLSHLESVSRRAYIADACEISASTSSKVSFRDKTYSLHGPYLGLKPGGEITIRFPTQNISDFTSAIDAAENDPAIQTLQRLAPGRLMAQGFRLNTVGKTVGVGHVYRGLFKPPAPFETPCGPGDLGLYYEYDVAKKAGFLKRYKLPVDMLVGQSGFEEINRLVGMPEFERFKADGKDNRCIMVETVDQRGKFGLPSQPRVPEVDLWKPGKGLRLVIR